MLGNQHKQSFFQLFFLSASLFSFLETSNSFGAEKAFLSNNFDSYEEELSGARRRYSSSGADYDLYYQKLKREQGRKIKSSFVERQISGAQRRFSEDQFRAMLPKYFEKEVRAGQSYEEEMKGPSRRSSFQDITLGGNEKNDVPKVPENRQGLFYALNTKERRSVLNPNQNVTFFLQQVLKSSPEIILSKMESILENSFRDYQKFQKLSYTPNHEMIPKESHKVWITGLGNKACEIPQIALKNYQEFVADFPELKHILWVLDEQDISKTLQILQKELPNVEVRRIAELKHFRGRSLFDYYLKNDFYCFASNVARFNVLYERGGLYTDMGWKVEKDAKHLFNIYQTILYPNYTANFFDVWCAAFKKNDPVLLGYLEYLESYKTLSLFAQKDPPIPITASLFCASPFTAFMYNGLDLKNPIFISPEKGVFVKSRFNSWNRQPKFNNNSPYNLPNRTEIIQEIFPRINRIANLGFFSERNGGDELFNMILKKSLYPFHIEKIPFWALKNPKNFIDHYDSYIIGGGDLINFAQEENFYFPRDILEKGKKAYVCGIGVHNQKKSDSNAIASLQKFLTHPNTEMITVRDLKSQKVLNETLGLKTVQKFPDLVFSLDLPYDNSIKERRKIGIIPREMGQGGYDLSDTVFQDLSQEVIEPLLRNGCEIDIISMRKMEKEYSAVQRFFLEPHSTVHHIPYETPEQNISAIQRCDALISMRYHGIILGAMLGKPVIGLDVSDKFKGLEDIFERSDIISKPSAPDLLKKVLAVSPVSYDKIEFLRQESQKQLEVLKGMLEKKSFEESIEN